MANRRAAKREDLLRRVCALIETWADGKRRTGWKSWVAKKAGVTLNWITLAVSRGEIAPPKYGSGPLDAGLPAGIGPAGAPD